MQRSDITRYAFGLVVEHLRKRDDLTQTELGERLGVAQSSISRLEDGRGAVDDAALKIIANFFELELGRVRFAIVNAVKCAGELASMTLQEERRKGERWWQCATRVVGDTGIKSLTRFVVLRELAIFDWNLRTSDAGDGSAARTVADYILSAFPNADIFLEGSEDPLGPLLGQGILGSAYTSNDVERDRLPVLEDTIYERYGIFRFPPRRGWKMGEATYVKTAYELRDLDTTGASKISYARIEPGRKWQNCVSLLQRLARAL